MAFMASLKLLPWLLFSIIFTWYVWSWHFKTIEFFMVYFQGEVRYANFRWDEYTISVRQGCLIPKMHEEAISVEDPIDLIINVPRNVKRGPH